MMPGKVFYSQEFEIVLKNGNNSNPSASVACGAKHNDEFRGLSMKLFSRSFVNFSKTLTGLAFATVLSATLVSTVGCDDKKEVKKDADKKETDKKSDKKDADKKPEDMKPVEKKPEEMKGPELKAPEEKKAPEMKPDTNKEEKK
jgi:type IV secretory pathway VirB10-like protein